MEEKSGIQSQTTETLEPKWVTVKLVLGILSMILFILVTFQSCAAGVGNALSDNGEVSGSFGFLVALNLLASCIIVVAASKSIKKAPMIIAAVLLWLNYFFAKMFGGTYSDLVIWGFISFAFGVVYLFSAMRTKKQYIIVAIVSAIYLAIALI